MVTHPTRISRRKGCGYSFFNPEVIVGKMSALKLFLVLIATFGGTIATPKIENDLLEQISQNGGTANVLISFYQNPSVLPRVINSLSAKVDQFVKISAIKTALEEEASLSQERVVSYLRIMSTEISFSSLWISNQLYIRNVQQNVLKGLLQFDEIVKISAERIFSSFNPVDVDVGSKIESYSEGSLAEWGVDKINAEAAFQLLRNVSGGNIPEIRVGVISTGAHASHQVIRESFLGEYGWYDPYGMATPIDEVGVGSHETGVIAGSNGVGVFPSAKWMSCRGCESFGCEEFALLRCAEFMTCPFYPNDTLPNCSKAAQVVHGDFLSAPGGTWFDKPLDVWQAAGIVAVWPVGGAGPECQTVRYPPESGKVISVGGTTPEDAWYERGSSGPTTSGRLKPEMVAPATNINSAWNLDDGTLVPLSATSCASAAVAGVVGMLKAYDPTLTFTQIVIALARGAERDGLAQVDNDRECGGIPSTTFPNNVFGFGRVDALGSLNYVIRNKQ